jgi:hypothetical protein
VVAAGEESFTLAAAGELVEVPYSLVARANLIDEGR